MSLRLTRCALGVAVTALVVGLWAGSAAAQSPTAGPETPTPSPSPEPERVSLELVGPATARPGDPLTYVARYTATAPTEVAFTVSSRGLVVVSSQVVAGRGVLLTPEPGAGEPVRWSVEPGSGEVAVTYSLAEPTGEEGFSLTASVFDSMVGHPRADVTTQLVPEPPATGDAGTPRSEPMSLNRLMVIALALATVGAATAVAWVVARARA